jgi:tRNA threonylcarbamoyladenosine dehydratase
MNNEYNEIFTRNIGLFTEADQDKLKKCSIGVAGLGGVGGLLAERLIRLGIGQLKIADPGLFEKSNLNRQVYSSFPNLGRNKAEVIYSQIKDINPEVRLSWSSGGIRTESEAESFINGCDIIIDERHIGLFKEAILLQRAARRKGIYYMFSVAYGFGALIVIFDPRGTTLEEYDGIPLDVDLEDPDKLQVPFEKIMPIIPSYASTMDVDIVRKMHLGELPGSVTSIGAGIASILAANETVNIILKKRRIVTAPEFIYVDLLDQTFTVKNILS